MAAGLPRHQSQHPGGMVISTQPLIDLCPIQPAAMEGRQMVQWDKDSCADAGFLKIDLLGLGMLSAVERCVEEIARTRNERIDLSRIDFDDARGLRARSRRRRRWASSRSRAARRCRCCRARCPRTSTTSPCRWRSCGRGRSRAGRCTPTSSARRRCARTRRYQVPYEHPSLEPVLQATRSGAIVFQDQVIEVAMAFAGFTAGEAEGLRRAMSRKRSEAAMRSYEQSSWRARWSAGSSPRSRSGCTTRSSASRASASPSRTRPRSGCWPTSPPGCACTTGPSSCARC